MAKKRRELSVIEKLAITDAGSEGKAVGKHEGRVVFVPYAAPGDVVDVKVTKKRKSYYEGKVVAFHSRSGLRTEPKCEHFGICGGCKWQHLDYRNQLQFKQKQVEDNLSRIGKFDLPEINPILSSEHTYYYRNKLEFTFTNRRWLTDFSKGDDLDEVNMNGLGFHIPGMFDRVLDLQNCYLQAEPSNSIRLAVKEYADQKQLVYYNVKSRTGFLRNLLIRNSSIGNVMVILVVNYEDPAIEEILKMLSARFPEITSLMYVVNSKLNDSISDLVVKLYKGDPFIIEEMEGLKFKVGPLSFFQTNSQQAINLYNVAKEFAGLNGSQVVYDLYTGTGTIANFIAENASKVIGIEYLAGAIGDAKENSRLNNIRNTEFYTGDIAEVLTDDFISRHGNPDVVITDPPRAGMHEKVVKQILQINPERIVYISCNPATQARDLNLLTTGYTIEKIQPVDMFPQTHHVENVVLLIRD